MSQLNIIYDDYDGIRARVYIQGDDQDAVRGMWSFLQATLTIYDKSRKYTWAAQHGYDDCLVRFLDGRHRTIPIGMIPRVTKYVQEKFGDKVRVQITKSVRNMFTPPFGKLTHEDIVAYADGLHMYDRVRYLKKLAAAGLTEPVGERFGDPGQAPGLAKSDFALHLFAHQEQLVADALNKRRVSLLACTSAGKSMSMMTVARYLVEKESKKVLIIVPNAALVEQLFTNFRDDYGWEDAGEHCTLIHSQSKDKLSKKQIEELKRLSIGEEATLREITISTWQSLRLKDESFFKVFGAVMVDEAHSAKGVELRDILGQCINANNFKVGFSGTLPDGDLDEHGANTIDAGYIEAGIGPIHEVVRLRTLIGQGILTPVEVKSIFIPYPVQLRPAICSQKTKYEVERAIVTENSSRKDVIDMLFNAGRINTSQNTVILFIYKDHMYEFLDFFKVRHPEFTYHTIEGDVSAAERNAISGKIEENTGNVVVATYGCMKQGVNIKLLHNLIFAEPMKSAYTVVQSVGRIVRRHPDKKLATVYDLVDDASYYTNPRNGGPGVLTHNYMVRHYYERVKYYAEEEIPIEEIHLDGIYEASISADDIKARRDRAVSEIQDAEEKASRRKKKPSKSKKPGRSSDPYGGRTFFTR